MVAAKAVLVEMMQVVRVGDACGRDSVKGLVDGCKTGDAIDDVPSYGLVSLRGDAWLYAYVMRRRPENAVCWSMYDGSS